MLFGCGICQIWLLAMKVVECCTHTLNGCIPSVVEAAEVVHLLYSAATNLLGYVMLIRKRKTFS